eukprot:363671-Chlamydomonas_euryale.AAC.2
MAWPSPAVSVAAADHGVLAYAGSFQTWGRCECGTEGALNNLKREGEGTRREPRSQKQAGKASSGCRRSPRYVGTVLDYRRSPYRAFDLCRTRCLCGLAGSQCRSVRDGGGIRSTEFPRHFQVVAEITTQVWEPPS